jgi:DNA modification methylase
MIDASLGGVIWNEAEMGNKTLNTKEARSDDDDRHLCALGLPLIERAIRLWSNENELIVSPFAGIGSEVGMAVKLGRRGWGCELKPLYAKTAAKNCEGFEAMAEQQRLF